MELIKKAVTAAVLGIAGGSAVPAATAQQMKPSFSVIGFIEDFKLTGRASPTQAAEMTVSNLPITLPSNLTITMPGRYVLPSELFPGGATSSGLALNDPIPATTPPRLPFEAEIIGNIVDGRYVAGVVHISQGALHAGAGFIQDIKYESGALTVGDNCKLADAGCIKGATVLLNDPKGIFGWKNDANPARAQFVQDVRFALDAENAPVHAKTGYPVCVPKENPDGPQTLESESCPNGNRPVATAANYRRYTCVSDAGKPAQPSAPMHVCSVEKPAPLRVGDYVTYLGILMPDTNLVSGRPYFISAYGLDAELGIYTSKDDDTVYLFVEEALQGTLGEAFDGIPQEETTRFRIVGFSTDPTRRIKVRILDNNRPLNPPAPGEHPGFTFTDGLGLPASNGPQMGRFRETWPSKDDARAVRQDVEVTIVGRTPRELANGLTSAKYTAPIAEYIYPEITQFGNPGFPSPVPFENFCFLNKSDGTYTSATVTASLGALVPFPNSGHNLSQVVGPGPVRACDNE